MARRKIVHIDEGLCNGCGECVPSCAEGAIRIIDGKARLVGDVLCDGLGACLGECPLGAISIIEREADAFDEEAVKTHLATAEAEPPTRIEARPGGCPGSLALQFGEPPAPSPAVGTPSQLRQWPVQLHLVSPQAPYYQGADVLLAADCCAFAVGDFHDRFLKGKAVAVACPKLDRDLEVYVDKLAAMIDQARINTLTVLMMQVPCCSGLLRLAQQAAARAGRKLPLKKIIVDVQGRILADEWL